MTINARALPIVKSLLPCDILSFGYPDGLSEADLLGSDLTVVDIVKHHGDETIADLNYPLNIGHFGLVLDPGTCEHVANVGCALRSLLTAVRLYGHIVQVAPITMFNHGLWNYSPSLLRDLYMDNGFELKIFEACNLHTMTSLPEFPLFERMSLTLSEVWLLIVAQLRDVVTWKWPIQAQYRR